MVSRLEILKTNCKTFYQNKSTVSSEKEGHNSYQRQGQTFWPLSRLEIIRCRQCRNHLRRPHHLLYPELIREPWLICRAWKCKALGIFKFTAIGNIIASITSRELVQILLSKSLNLLTLKWEIIKLVKLRRALSELWKNSVRSGQTFTSFIIIVKMEGITVS